MRDPRMIGSEREWQAMVIDAARMYGWRVWHFHDSRRMVRGKLIGDRDAAGFPDLVLAHPRHGVAYAEMKRTGGRTSPVQNEAIQSLRSAGAVVFVWRPADWPEVLVFLKDGAAPVGAGYPDRRDQPTPAAAPLAHTT